MENDNKPQKRKLSDIEETLEETEQDKEEMEPSKETLPGPEKPEKDEEPEEKEEQTDEQREKEKERTDNQNGIFWDSSGRRWGCISASMNANRTDDLKCDRSTSVSTCTSGRIWIQEPSGLEVIHKLFEVSGATKLWNKTNASGYLYDRFNNNTNQTPELPFKCCRDCDWLIKELCPHTSEQKEKETTNKTQSLLDMYSYGFCGPKHPHHRMCMQLEILEVLGKHRVFRLLESTDATQTTKENKAEQNQWIAYFEPNLLELRTEQGVTSVLTWPEVMEDSRFANWENKTKKHLEDVMRECKVCSMGNTIQQKLSTLSEPLRQRMVCPVGPTGTIVVTPHFRASDLHALSRSSNMVFFFIFLFNTNAYCCLFLCLTFDIGGANRFS